MSDFSHLPPYSVDLVHVPHSAQDGVDWALASYGIPALWQHTRGEGVTVAVIDSGIAPHPSLTNVIDVRNFTSDSEPYDTLGHGTHVAGIIGAVTGSAKGIAPAVQLVGLKVLGHSGMGSNQAVAEAVLHAVERKVDIVCMSLGSPGPSSMVHKAVQMAEQAGVIVVCAAGNDGGSVNYPAAFQETIAVGAVDHEGNVCPYSSRGKEIVVAAPGENITSTWVGAGYACVSGTSMAAPFVAGVLSLWVSAQKREGSPISHASAVDALSKTSTDVGPAGKDDESGWGLVDPHRMVNYAKPSGVTIYIPGARVV
jgi:subtilisin family serine protease